MNKSEKLINIIFEELLNSYPIIDFIDTIPVDSFQLNGKLQFIQY